MQIRNLEFCIERGFIYVLALEKDISVQRKEVWVVIKHFFETGISPHATWSECCTKDPKINSFSSPLTKLDIYPRKRKLVGEINEEIKHIKIDL